MIGECEIFLPSHKLLFILRNYFFVVSENSLKKYTDTDIFTYYLIPV